MNDLIVSIFLNGRFQYDAGNIFMQMLANELEKKVQVFRIDVSQPENQVIEMMNMAIQIRSTCFLAYNGIFSELKYGQDQSLYDGTNIPMLAWLVDHPLHHRSRLEAAGKRVIVGCIDKAQTDLVEQITTQKLSSFFCPHFACIPSNTTLEEADPLPENSSELRVIFPGSFGPPAETQAQKIISKSPISAELFQVLTEAAARDAGFDIFSAAINCLQSLNIRLSPKDLSNFLANTVLPIDGYIRAKRREELLAAMKTVGISVDIYGNGPEHHPAFEGHRHHGPIGFQELLNRLKYSDVLLDSGANFSNGTHERVLTGLGLGNVVVTPKNRLWTENFDRMSEVLLYQPSATIEVAEQILALRNQKIESNWTISGQAKQLVMEKFSVSSTANTILDVLSLEI